MLRRRFIPHAPLFSRTLRLLWLPRRTRSKSVKQALTATSSTHAEIKALYQLTVDLIYIINLCYELDRPVDLPAIIFEDKSPAVQLTESLSAKAKSKSSPASSASER